MAGMHLKRKIFLLIRLALILSILVNLATVFIAVITGENPSGAALLNKVSKNLEFVAFGALTLALTFGSSYIEKREKIDIPDILEIVIVIFLFAGIFLSARYNLYYRFFWWDDLLHTLSGMIIGFIGFIVIYKINHNYSMNISPLLVAIFSFTFAVSLGVLWEFFEFGSDMLIGTANQKWDLPDTAVLMGKPYQGSGLRDTMSDLIVDSIGALATSTITFFMYKYQKAKALAELKKMILD